MKRSGIGGWRANQVVHVGSLSRTCDFVFLRERVIVEIDGWAWHHTPDRFNADRFKQNALTNGGWRVLRFTWLDLTQRPGYACGKCAAPWIVRPELPLVAGERLACRWVPHKITGTGPARALWTGRSPHIVMLARRWS